jgi:hypothetical protein
MDRRYADGVRCQLLKGKCGETDECFKLVEIDGRNSHSDPQPRRGQGALHQRLDQGLRVTSSVLNN